MPKAQTYSLQRIVKTREENSQSIRDKFDWDIPIQRGFVWNLDEKSLLIHSILQGYDIPPIQTQRVETENGYKLNVLDGKQRLSTITQFYCNEFKLSKKTEKVILDTGEEYEIAGKYFDELDKPLQDAFLSATIDIYEIEGLTEQQRDTLFYRYNQGKPLTKFELTKGKYHGPELDKIVSLSRLPFFKKIRFSKPDMKRMVDQQLIIQIMMLLDLDETDFTYKTIDKYTEKMTQEGISEEIYNKVAETANWLDEVFYVEEPEYKKFEAPKTKGRGRKPSKTKIEKEQKEVEKYNKKLRKEYEEKLKEKTLYLKKVHIPSLFIAAIKARELPIAKEDFYDWFDNFMSDNVENEPQEQKQLKAEYKEKSMSETTKKESVRIRKENMLKHMLNYFNVAQ